MIQNVIAKSIKYALLLALLAYIGVIATSRWHNIRVYPQKIGCSPVQEAIVVEKNIWWIVSKRIEITKENSYYNKLMKKVTDIEISERHTNQLKEFPCFSIASKVNFCFKDGIFKDIVNEQSRYPIRWITIPFKNVQPWYKENMMCSYWGSGGPRKRSIYTKEKIDAFFSDLDSAIKEQEIINKGR